MGVLVGLFVGAGERVVPLSSGGQFDVVVEQVEIAGVAQYGDADVGLFAKSSCCRDGGSTRVQHVVYDDRDAVLERFLCRCGLVKPELGRWEFFDAP